MDTWEAKVDELQMKHKKEKEAHKRALKESKQEIVAVQDHMEEHVALLRAEHKEAAAALSEDVQRLTAYRDEARELKVLGPV